MSFTLPNGTALPKIGLGTSGVPEESILENAIDKAIEIGYRHIDSAYVYNNEKVIGRSLQKWFTSGKLKREDIFITTKLPVTGMHVDKVEHFLKLSLSNLKLEYVDLYLIHFPAGCKYENDHPFPTRDENGKVKVDVTTNYISVWKKMEEQVDAGLARNIGLSNFNLSQIQKILSFARIKPANLQVELNVYLQQPELVEFCHKNGITVVGYSPLGASNHNEKMKKAFGDYKERNLHDILGDPVINNIATKYSKTAAQVMLRFLIQVGVAPIPKSHTPHRIKENFDIFNFTLDDEDMAALRSLDIGEEARVTGFQFFPGIEEHPDFPFHNFK